MDPERSASRRRCRLIIAAMVLLVCFYALWSNLAGRSLEKQVAAYRAAGEPIELSDFAAPPVADADNAALALRSAARIDETTAAWKTYQKLAAAPPLTDAEAAAIRAVVAENSAAFDDVQTAMARKGVDWQIHLRSPAIATILPDCSPQRSLAMLVINRALLKQHDGDDALSDLLAAQFIAAAMDRQPFLVCHVLAEAMRMRVADTLQQMAPTLRIGQLSQASRMIALLLDDSASRAALQRADLGERALELDTARCLADGRLSIFSITGGSAPPPPIQAIVGVMGRSMAQHDGLVMVRQVTAMMRAAAAAPDWPAFKRLAPPNIPPAVAAAPRLHAVAVLLLPDLSRSVEMSFRQMTSAHLAAAALAARCYQLEQGHLPTDLAQLVPKYLPRVPSDPMSAGQPLTLTSGSAGPVIRSIGKNAPPAPPRRAPLDPSQQQTMQVHLTPQPRRPAPAPAPAPAAP